MGRESEETFPKEDIHMTSIINEKISRIINLQGNANQNHNGKSPCICQNGVIKKNTCWQQCGEKERELSLRCWWECELVQPPCNSMKVPQNTNNRTTT